MHRCDSMVLKFHAFPRETVIEKFSIRGGSWFRRSQPLNFLFRTSIVSSPLQLSLPHTWRGDDEEERRQVYPQGIHVYRRNIRPCAQLLCKACVFVSRARERIYRHQQGIRPAILSKRDLSQIRKFVRGCGVYGSPSRRRWTDMLVADEVSIQKTTRRGQPENMTRKYRYRLGTPTPNLHYFFVRGNIDIPTESAS